MNPQLFGRPRFKGSDAESFQTRSCCFKERCCILFDIHFSTGYSAMSTEYIPARNLLELVSPAIHNWQLVFTMWPKVGRNLPWLVCPVLHERRQSFSMWPKVGTARRTPHLVSICLRTFHTWRGYLVSNSGGRHFTATLMRDLSRFWSPPTSFLISRFAGKTRDSCKPACRQRYFSSS